MEGSTRSPVRPARPTPWPTHPALLGLVLLLVFALPAAAADTWYIRGDGGDATQCTGRSDAPYPGSGDAQPCAWNHPFVAFPPGKPARIAGGDTVIVASGDYRMGIGAPETEGCDRWQSRDCHMSPIPSGPTAGRRTRLLGADHDRGCANPPQLWGSERAEMVLNLHGSSNVEIACLEITDRSSCIEHHCNSGNCRGEVAACRKDAPPYGDWAYVGLSARDAENVRLRDINIHGMASMGVRAGRIADWDSERLTLRANGWAGWDSDLGGESGYNRGDIVFRETTIAWNGCGERWPSGEIFGCWARHGGGYGDGIATGASGGHWLFEDSIIRHNTSDGIDLLYLDASGRVTVRRTWLEGNAGNQIKTRGAARIENSVIVGNCGFFADGHPNMQGSDHCRAAGNTLSLGLFADTTVDVINNTITGEGDCILLTVGGSETAQVNVVNNLLIGEVDWREPHQRSCLVWSEGRERLNWQRNFITGVKGGECPPGSLCGGDPQITERSFNAFDPTPKAGSPLIDAAHAPQAPPHDYYRLNRNVGAGPDIGPIEFGASAGGAPTAPAEPLRIATLTVQRQAAGAGERLAARVRVVGTDGRPATGVRVIAKWRDAGLRTAEARTDADGAAVIDGGVVATGTVAGVCAAIRDDAVASHETLEVCAGPRRASTTDDERDIAGLTR